VIVLVPLEYLSATATATVSTWHLFYRSCKLCPFRLLSTAILMILKTLCQQWVSRYEGDLVAKCYFAKHKLVWEVLDGGLKSKIEIQWSDICGIKMFCPENENGTLEIAVRRFEYNA
jgi:hypothetical protein